MDPDTLKYVVSSKSITAYQKLHFRLLERYVSSKRKLVKIGPIHDEDLHVLFSSIGLVPLEHWRLVTGRFIVLTK